MATNKNIVDAAIKAGLVSPLHKYSRIDKHFAPTPSYQPPLLLKAYAIALRDKFGGETDLSRPAQAIFVASPQQKGIPASVAVEYSNEQLFQHANAMQNSDSIGFQPNRDTYFGYLDQYLAGAKSDDSSSPEDWQAYKRARSAAELEADNLYQEYISLLEDDNPPKWQEFVKSDKGKEYREAWDLREKAARQFHLDNPGLLQALQVMDQSKSKADPRQGQNMPSTLKEVQTTDEGRFKVDWKDVFYRPAHVLTGYYLDAPKWRDDYEKSIPKPARVELDLPGAFSTSWKSLGFPQFDDMESHLTTKDLSALDGWKISLTYTAMQPYVVGRGSWDIPAFRGLYKLHPEAEDYLRKNINKTVTLLLAYGVQLRLTRPTAMLPSAHSINLPGILGGVSLEKVSDTELQSPRPKNDAYPVLLAVLAQKC